MDLSVFVDAVTTLAIAGGLMFAAIEWRANRRARRRQSQLVLLRSFDSPEFVQSMKTIFDLPEGLTQEEIVAQRGPAAADLVWYWTGVMETLGFMTFRREIDIRDVDETLGGPIIISLARLGRYIEAIREESRDTMHEWFQWLGERLMELERDEGRTPAHVREAAWRP